MNRLPYRGFVALELVQGCQNNHELARLNRFIAGMPRLWPSAAVCEEAYRRFQQLHLRHRIGLLDVLIAHTAIEAAMPLHTFNRKHYEPINELVVVQPYER